MPVSRRLPSRRQPKRQSFPSVALVAFALALTFGFGAFAGSAAAADPGPADCASARPRIVKIHADWCGSCRATADVWARIEKELADEATIIRFDVTDRVGHDAAKARANALGLDDFFQEYRRRTGVIAFLASGSETPTTLLAGERDFARYRTALDATIEASLVGGDCAAE